MDFVQSATEVRLPVRRSIEHAHRSLERCKGNVTRLTETVFLGENTLFPTIGAFLAISGRSSRFGQTRSDNRASTALYILIYSYLDTIVHRFVQNMICAAGILRKIQQLYFSLPICLSETFVSIQYYFYSNCIFNFRSCTLLWRFLESYDNLPEPPPQCTCHNSSQPTPHPPRKDNGVIRL